MRIKDLAAAIAPQRAAVLGHPLYALLDTEAAAVTFMEHHVFAVWDFMALLKALQAELTCTRAAWVPVGPAEVRRLVNEIVMAEESDQIGPACASHFELYLAAMSQAGADTGPAERFTRHLLKGRPVRAALEQAPAPMAAAEFVTGTWALVSSGEPHELAAAFAFGREDLIPEMFRQVELTHPGRLSLFEGYLSRHMDLDERHGELARSMVAQLCGTDPARWAAATEAAHGALRARAQLWDGVADAITLRAGAARLWSAAGRSPGGD